MTHPAPHAADFDDGLVHAHGWCSSTPPGCDPRHDRERTSGQTSLAGPGRGDQGARHRGDRAAAA